MADLNETFEADAKMNVYVNQVVKDLKAFGRRTDGTYAENYVMSLGIAIVSQLYVSLGGLIDTASSEKIGDMVKAGIITTLKAYSDARRVTHKPSGRIN